MRRILLLLISGFLSSCIFREPDIFDIRRAKDKPYAPCERYCYRTLGNVDCYNEPLVGHEHRLVGVYKVGDPEQDKLHEERNRFNLNDFLSKSIF